MLAYRPLDERLIQHPLTLAVRAYGTFMIGHAYAEHWASWRLLTIIGVDHTGARQAGALNSPATMLQGSASSAGRLLARRFGYPFWRVALPPRHRRANQQSLRARYDHRTTGWL